MPRRGNKRKKKRNTKELEPSEREIANTPRCFVVKKGKVGERVEDLVQDLREVMAPNCATKLKETKLNRIEDYMAVAQHFHVSHIFQFSATKAHNYMRIIKLPLGPTLTFQVNSFSTSRDVRASQRKQPVLDHTSFEMAPIQIINGFSQQSKLANAMAKQLSAEMLRGVLPPVDVPNFNQSSVRRAALFNYDPEEDTVLFRHYSIMKKGIGLQRGVAKLMRTHRTLRLGNRQDIADFVLSDGQGATETEIEDKPEEAPSATGGKIGVRLHEIGPRLTLQLIKAEEGVCTGTVMYHRFNVKPPTKKVLEEAKATQRRKFKARNTKLEEAVAKRDRALAKAKERRKKKEQDEKEDREEWGLDPLKQKGDQKAGNPGKQHKNKGGKRGAPKKKIGAGGKGGGKAGGKAGGKGKSEGSKGSRKGGGKGKAGASASGSKRGNNTMDKFKKRQKTA